MSRILMQTLTAEDVTLNNNLSPVEPRWNKGFQGRQLALGFGIEQILADNLGVEAGGEWESISPRASQGNGAFGNVTLVLKYVFLSLPEIQLALGPEVSFPTNSHIGDEAMDTDARIMLTWGGRLIELSATGWERYLRAVEFQGDLEYSHTFGHPAGNLLLFDPVLDYSLPYLNYSANPDIPWPVDNLCIFTELNVEQSLSGPEGKALSVFVTPGLAYMTPAYQLTAGVQLPLNHHASRGENVAVIGSIIITIGRVDLFAALSQF
jgi:hypothetical protein